jgi:hypothetical protein
VSRNMKTISSLVFVFALATFVPRALFAQQPLKEQVEIESTIHSRLASKIVNVIAPEQFKLIITAKAESVTERIPLEGETTSQVDGTKRNTATSVAPLPGFQVQERPGDKDPEKLTQETKSKYRFNTYTKISQININLILDENLAPDRKAFVENLVRQDMDTTMNGVANLSVASFPLTVSYKSWWQAASAWLSDYWTTRGSSAVDLLYIAAMVLLFLLAIIGLVRKWRKVFSKTPVPTVGVGGGQEKSDSADASIEIAINEIIDRLVDRVSRNPLEVGCFLRQLQPEGKRSILDATKTPAMRSHFQQITGLFGEAERRASSTSDRKSLRVQLEAIEKDLERFLTIQTIQTKKMFGYLPLLLDEHLISFVSVLQDKVVDISILAKHLAKPQFDLVSDRLSIDEKAQLFKLMRLGAPSLERVQLLDRQLREHFERLKDQSSMFSKSSQDVERDFLEHADNVGELIEALKAQQVELPPAYEKYMITFDKLLTLDKTLLREVLGRVSNETLARALVKQSFSDLIRESLGDIRSKLIDSTKSLYANSNSKEISQAQREILKTYWKLV